MIFFLMKFQTKTLANRLRMTTYATVATANQGHHYTGLRLKPKGEYVPVCVALGLILVSLSFGAHTAKQQLMHSPTVSVKKSRRETVPEVTDPDRVAEESKNFISRGFFRRVAHVQDTDTREHEVPDPISTSQGSRRRSRSG